MKNNLLYINDSARGHDKYKIYDGQRFDSKIDIFNDTGERIFEPLHNKTVIAGAAFTLQKLFSLDRNSLENTPTYDEIMDLDDAATASAYPTVSIADGNGLVVGSIPDETQRVILGFCFGMGGAGLESSDVFDVPYASWITPDMIVPFRYPLLSVDDVDEVRKPFNSLEDRLVVHITLKSSLILLIWYRTMYLPLVHLVIA